MLNPSILSFIERNFKILATLALLIDTVLLATIIYFLV